MKTEIHPTAIVDSSSEVGEGTVIGPYCIIGPNVTLGENCWLQNHVTIAGSSTIGSGNRFFSYGSIGQQTQDLKYVGEPTYLTIGDNNCFREFVTIHRGTAVDGHTTIGNDGNFLAYTHIAHDCQVGDRVIFSNNGTLAGHVLVEDHVIVGGLTAIHQFCRIGKHAITGGCSKIVQDVPPFMIADGNPAVVRSINKIGLERGGFDRDVIRDLRQAFRLIYRGEWNTQQAVEKIETEIGSGPEIEHLCKFIRESERGIIR